MDWLVITILLVVAVVGFCYGILHTDETIIELSDDEAEEYRKQLIEREEKDVELDNE